MAGLPKIVLARLKAKPGAPKSSSVAEGNAGLPGARHPDANLLAAFVEQSLSERERTRVLHHLAQCAECREVAALVLPAESAVAEPARAGAGPRWSPWLVLRWGAMAAALGTLTIVVILRSGRWQGHREIADKMSLPAPAGNVTSPSPTVSTPPLTSPPPKSAPTQARTERTQPSGELGAIKKPSGAPEDLALNKAVARAQAKQQVTVMASSRPPATLKVERVPAVTAAQEESRGGAFAAGPPAAPLTAPAPTSEATTASEGVAKAGGVSPPGPAAFRATTQSVEVIGAIPGARSADAASANVAARMAAQPRAHLTAQAPMVEAVASREESKSVPSPPAALWSVASDGIVQRSTDGGKTFEQIPIARGIKFRAIAALGTEVWTGGTGGALFHSADGGATWARLAINFEGNTLTETITDIQMRDPQHLTVTTASGSQWVSEDGGQHWRKQP